MSAGWINVKDKTAKGTIAKGDGVHDDWEAINNAIIDVPKQRGAVLFFPPGIYASSGPVYISNKSNFVILGYGAIIKIPDNAPYYNNSRTWWSSQRTSRRRTSSGITGSPSCQSSPTE